MIKILPDKNDDSNFIQIIENILNGFIKNISPEEIRIIKIDTWFDFKWRAFAGKAVGAVGFWNEKVIRIPPFIPDRVLEEIYFEKFENTYHQQDNAGFIHIYQGSSENLTGKRKLVAFCGHRMFFWFSGNTKNTMRGSVMLYQIDKENSATFYISFLKKDNWQIYKTDQISRKEVLSLMK
jgi:hypothetical protein